MHSKTSLTALCSCASLALPPCPPPPPGCWKPAAVIPSRWWQAFSFQPVQTWQLWSWLAAHVPVLREVEGSCKTQLVGESRQPRGNANFGSGASAKDGIERDPLQLCAFLTGGPGRDWLWDWHWACFPAPLLFGSRLCKLSPHAAPKRAGTRISFFPNTDDDHGHEQRQVETSSDFSFHAVLMVFWCFIWFFFSLLVLGETPREAADSTRTGCAVDCVQAASKWAKSTGWRRNHGKGLASH